MKQRAEEFVNSKVSELNGLAPLKSEVIKWLIDFASDEVKAINYNRCCKSDSEQLCDKEKLSFDWDGKKYISRKVGKSDM